MPTRLRLSCRALLIIVLVRPVFYSALCLAIVQSSRPFTLTEFIWPPGETHSITRVVRFGRFGVACIVPAHLSVTKHLHIYKLKVGCEQDTVTYFLATTAKWLGFCNCC